MTVQFAMPLFLLAVLATMFIILVMAPCQLIVTHTRPHYRRGDVFERKDGKRYRVTGVLFDSEFDNGVYVVFGREIRGDK